MPKFMITSKTKLARMSTSLSTDQRVSLKMVNAILMDLKLMVAKMLRLGNGLMKMMNTCHMPQVSCHHLTEESLIRETLRESLYGLTLVILDKLSHSKSMAPNSKLQSKL